MEHARCASCRNPIRARQPRVELARADMSFHGDCWVTLHATVQQGYVDRGRDEGIGTLLEPYQRTQMASWLPEAAIDAAVESLTGNLETTEDLVTIGVLETGDLETEGLESLETEDVETEDVHDEADV